MSKVFISYSRSDSAFVDRLEKELESRGFDVWVDRADIGAGSAWRAEIAQAIRGCDAFVLVFSPRAAGSVNISKELALADNYEKRILPVVLEHHPVPVSMEYQLAGLQQIHFDTGDISDGLNRLLAVLPEPAGGLVKPAEPESAPRQPETRKSGRKRRRLAIMIVIILTGTAIGMIVLVSNRTIRDEAYPVAGDPTGTDDGSSEPAGWETPPEEPFERPAGEETYLYEKPGIYEVSVPASWTQTSMGDYFKTFDRYVSPDGRMTLDIEIGPFGVSAPDGVLSQYHMTWQSLGTFFQETGRSRAEFGWIISGYLQDSYGTIVNHVAMFAQTEDGINATLVLYSTSDVDDARLEMTFKNVQSSFIPYFDGM